MPGEPMARAVQLPLGPSVLPGHAYTLAGDGRTTYHVWSLNHPSPVLPKEGDAFFARLDACAELAWALLVEPAERRARRAGPREYAMSFAREVPGWPFYLREYYLRLGPSRGTVSIFSDGARVLVAAAHSRSKDDPNVERFLDSFGVRLKAAGREAMLTRRSFDAPR
ncbi:MAG TPA: hypothetical protein VGV38_10335, partial [Pyrinomonadaceae bacterium]|nr:hypothetical protein [Pyrinomonadaceae bacterium]